MEEKAILSFTDTVEDHDPKKAELNLQENGPFLDDAEKGEGA